MPEQSVLNLEELRVRPVERSEEGRHQELMAAHHYLGSLPKIGETLWYVATYHSEWVALLSFSAAALKCAARDRWIGWDFRHQYDRPWGDAPRRSQLVVIAEAGDLDIPAIRAALGA